MFLEQPTDWEQSLTECLPTAGGTLADHGGELTVRNEASEITEGDWDHDMIVVVAFPSVEDARARYEGPAYVEVKPTRRLRVRLRRHHARVRREGLPDRRALAPAGLGSRERPETGRSLGWWGHSGRAACPHHDRVRVRDSHVAVR